MSGKGIGGMFQLLESRRLLVCGMGLGMLLGAAQGLAAASPPNVVFILADDLGWRDTSATGSTFYRTPHIESLASQGLRFTDAYATPLCSPSRGAVLTGRYPERFQMYAAITGASQAQPKTAKTGEPHQKTLAPGSRSFLPRSEVTIAEILRDAGYATHFLGKWHLGVGGNGPAHHGFQNVPVFGGAGAGYFSPYKFLPKEFSSGPDGEYLPERFTEEALAIRRHEAKRKKPFFLALWHFNVHSPYEAKPDAIEKYRALADPANPQRHPVMGAMVEALDHSIGRVLAELESLGLADNTIVIFASDNGGVGWKHGEDTVPITSNLPARGWKGTLMEGGVRVPMIIRWPGVTPAGKTTSVPVHLVDLLPTLATAAGAGLPANVELDGMDLRPVIEGRRSQRERPLLQYFPMEFIPNGARSAAALRDGDYKIIRFFAENGGKDAHELYNVATDVAESRNLAAEQPERLADLARKLDNELARIGARIPAPNPAYNPKAPLPRNWRGKLLKP